MSLSWGELEGVIRALAPWKGSRIQGISCPAPSRLVLELYRPGQTLILLLVGRGPQTRIHPLQRRPQNPSSPLTFQMLCRKELGGTLTDIHLCPDDRVLMLEIERHEIHRTLVAELTGRHGNLLLLDEHHSILGTALPNLSQRRSLVPGQPWVAPSPDPFPVGPHRWSGLEGDQMLSAVRDFFEAQDQVSLREQVRGELLRRIRAQLRHDRKLVDNLQRDLTKAEAATSLRRVADLIQIYLKDIPRGTASWEVLDIFEEPAQVRHLSLDPALSPLENMQAMYHKSGRLEGAINSILERAARAEEGISRGLRLEALTQGANSLEELRKVETELGPGKVVSTPGRRSQEVRLPYHAFITRDGQEIRVGRSARDNSSLTTSSRGNDFWLHVVGHTGAHVVVPAAAGPPSLHTLLDAATLALKYSGIREGDAAEVAYTRVKFVRKVPGVPGKVTYSQEKTLHVRLEVERLSHLHKRESEINSPPRGSTATPLLDSSHSAKPQ